MKIDHLIGERREWTIPISDHEEMMFTGTYLGMSSTHGPDHKFRGQRIHSGPHAPSGTKCSTCRWREFRIFRDTGGGKTPYILHSTGRSSVPGERIFYGVKDGLTARGVIEALTTRRGRTAYLSSPAGMVLAQAASFDMEIARIRDKNLVI